ncbi:MAG: hypothetical protein RM368_16705 [Nostoc sp. DedSLP03]|uniref:RNA polymerase sigma factor n=1 Tax=Nostoc sp. DedSLP03 TaxID=3075400 RepID=UPI002AD1DFAB|nr:hypothetical protein [Nostoc sp. DedSLP03]MDZ7966592.1 hypothetical protein [Nostoc sp. DedSLP03]
MNTLSSCDVRWDVLKVLYSRLQRLTPGTKEAEITEHALSLALNYKRQSKNVKFFLYKDVLNNAKYSILRTQARRSALYQKLTAYSVYGVGNYETPEAICIAYELEFSIRKAVKQLDPKILRCLDGMLVDESIAETAVACGISRRSVERARHKIREISQSILFEQKAG